MTMHDIYNYLVKKVAKYHILQDYVLANLKHIKGKQYQLIIRGVATMQITLTTFSFPEISKDDYLKQQQMFLECSLSKKNKFMAI